MAAPRLRSQEIGFQFCCKVWLDDPPPPLPPPHAILRLTVGAEQHPAGRGSHPNRYDPRALRWDIAVGSSLSHLPTAGFGGVQNGVAWRGWRDQTLTDGEVKDRTGAKHSSVKQRVTSSPPEVGKEKRESQEVLLPLPFQSPTPCEPHNACEVRNTHNTRVQHAA